MARTRKGYSPRHGALVGAVMGLMAAACASAAPASGEWRLDPRRCPDLIEDRLDRAVTRGAADLREDIRDARVVNCPARAWVWTPARRAVAVRRGSRRVVVVRPARPVITTFHVRRGGYFYRPRRGGAFISVRLAL